MDNRRIEWNAFLESALCHGYGIGYSDNGTGILKTGYEAHSNQRFILDNEH